MAHEHATTDAERPGIDPASGTPRRVCILNQYWVPDVASTGYLLHELAVELARLGFHVEVITTKPGYGPKETRVDCPARETIEGVEIRRIWTTRFSKDNLLGRVTNFTIFMAGLFLRMLVWSRPDTVYLYTTNPPFLSVIGALVSLVRRHHYVHLLHDAYPDIAAWVGTIKPAGAIEKTWHAVNRLCYARSKQAIVLCRKARDLVCSHYPIPRQRTHVIPNWADAREFRPLPKPDSAFAARHALLDRFVVMYSGNLGLYYEFDTVLGAARRLADEPFTLVLIGGGGQRDDLERKIAAAGLRNTLLLPYQPRAQLNDSLAAADASLVSIAEGIEGISFPSKLYTSLAVGRPVLALSEPDSELRDLVEHHDVGAWCALGDADAMAERIRALMRDPPAAQRQGSNARALFEHAFTRETCSKRYASVLLAAHPLAAHSAAELRLDSISAG